MTIAETLEGLQSSGEPEPSEVSGSPDPPSGPPGPMLYRAAGEMTVRYPDREIEVVAHPYNEEAIVPWSDGRIVSEICEPGAYAEGIRARAGRIHVNRDHLRERACGRTMSLHPERSEGLVAKLRISRTPLGDETLELAADGVLHASVGYKPLPGGEKWSRDRRQVRLTRCWLYHIALVPEPAYDGADVLSVRSTSMATEVAAHVVAAMTPAPDPVATPNLDEVLAWLNSGRYSLTTTE